ncbi:RIC1-domain-containing protein [Stereum hirsutum FP-91666 SS1]|uniref:RIC1-domain-containing protein n=1 Tax=Stereum hirsutum (strain FP-91666) TaxID=721885 RepID=UPI000444A431|nr:RIC1-domain-containing protein [Stereum hirsutum FP-91666 SS1]EIM83316.1 RIC1-domain-containing protein [Stereum hirsutum FP-91666 SS1]
MYFPTSAARQLCTVPALPNALTEPVIQVCPSTRKSLFCTLTRDGLAVWRVRPSAMLTYLSRTATSLEQHGENKAVHWSTDGRRIVIQTTRSFLVLVTVHYNPEETPYKTPPLGANSQRSFLPGPGEALPLQSIVLQFEGVIRVEGILLSVSPRKHYILFSTKSPPSIQRIPWPTAPEDELYDRRGNRRYDYDSWVMNEDDFPWLVDPDVTVCDISWYRGTDVESWITSDGRAYFVQLSESAYSDVNMSNPDVNGEDSLPDTLRRQYHSRTSVDSSDSHSQPSSEWHGTCIHDIEVPKWVQKQRAPDPEDEDGLGASGSGGTVRSYEQPRRAVKVAVNTKFSMIAVGTSCGSVEFTAFPSSAQPSKPHVLQLPHVFTTTNRSTSINGQSHNNGKGPVCTMEWSSDGYVLAVGWKHGWAVWSVAGRCLAWGFGVEEQVDEERFQDAFMYGIKDLFWVPGNFELIVLAQSSPNRPDGQLFILPFAKSATTGQHVPDNSEYAFLQMDDRALVYRGADQPDMSVINPESDVWQHIKIPQSYLAANWPIRYSTISADGRLIAVAGRRGLAHYSSASGRWKLFADELQEQAFVVKGGMLWFHHVLIATVEVAKSWQIRLYSRDMELSNQNVLHRELLQSPVVILSLVDNSLLVYTADNTLHHFLIVPTTDTIQLHLCGSITFEGIIANPNAVRVLSWMIPSAQKHLGDPMDDLSVATVLMMVGGQLVLLRPRKSATQEVRYDMQILADRIEFCWIHLRGIGSLENSLWGFDGQGMRVWLNALHIEQRQLEDATAEPREVKESVNIPLDFYPLSVLMDKGIIIGAEHETTARANLPFVLFRHATSSHLFLHHILLVHLAAGQVQQAVQFASHYQHLVFFAHALEILLHTVVESDASSGDDSDDGHTVQSLDVNDGLLPAVIEFLDHFDVALDVVVGCARKTEMTRWRRLFDVVGNPKVLFETCLKSNRLRTAGSYLLVLHSLEQLDESNEDALRLLRSAVEAKDWQLSRELLRFLHSIDTTGGALKEALRQPFMFDVPNGVSDRM